MKNKYLFVVIMLGMILFVGMGLTSVYVHQTTQEQEEKDLTVVTSFYPMYIAASNVIGQADGVRLENLSEPQTGCLHDFQLTPEDMKLLSTADVFIINGGGIESFMKEVAAAYPDLKIIEACENTPLLTESGEEEHGHDHEEAHTDQHEDTEETSAHEDHDHGDVNAHAWMSVAAYETQVQTIAEELEKVDTVRSQTYQENAAVYLDKLNTLKERQTKLKEELSGQSVVLFHEAYAYVAADYGLNVKYVLDLDEERQVSAGEVSDVLTAIRQDDVHVILAEKLYGKSMGDTVTKETDVSVLYLDPLNRGDYDKDSYISGMTKNMDILEEAFHAKDY